MIDPRPPPALQMSPAVTATTATLTGLPRHVVTTVVVAAIITVGAAPETLAVRRATLIAGIVGEIAGTVMT